MDLDGGNQKRVVTGVGNSILLDFHYTEGRVYWADKKTGVIYKAAMDGTQRQKLHSSEKGISGLAVDWVHNFVIWTSGEMGTIKRVDTNGKNERTLLSHLSQPISIAVAPNDRFIFWLSDGITPSIQRSEVEGEMITTVLKIPERLGGLSVDRMDKRLFWVQFSLEGESAIGSCDYNGNVINVIDQSQSLGMSVFLEQVYYTDMRSRTIRQVNKYSGGEAENISLKRMTHPPTAVKVVHPLSQPVEDPMPVFPACDGRTGVCVNVCSNPAEQGICQCTKGFALSKHGNYCEDVNECGLWDHGCSLGCENIPGSYFCTCPKGYALLPDRKTCQETSPCLANMTQCNNGCLATDEGTICVCPEGSILQPDGQTCRGCSSSDRGGCSQQCSPITPGRWECDCLPGYKLHQDGKRCTATGPPPYLLFANIVNIRRVNLDGTGDQSLVEEPRGTVIALDYDPVQNKVYFASTVLKQIERADLDGGSREVLLTEGLDSPEGMAVDWVNRKLYWTDRGWVVYPKPILTKYDTYSYCNSIVSSDWSGRPFDLVVFEDRLWITDREQQLLLSVDKQTGMNLKRLHGNMVQPASIVVVHPLAKPGANVCLYRNGGCAQVCESRLGFAHCSCHSHIAQSGDGKGCFPSYGLTGDMSPNPFSRKNKTLNDESMPIPPTLFIEKMVSDQDDCFSLRCDVNSQCLLDGGNPTCHCLEGFTGDGELCVDLDECMLGMALCSSQSSVCVNTAGGYYCQCRPGFSGEEHHCTDIDECKMGTHKCDERAECINTIGKYRCKCQTGYSENGHTCQELSTTSSWLTTSRPMDVTSQWLNTNTVESCPSSHDTYCLYEGVCFYFPEMESYACNCISGYMGERCQFSDLEWWELQQAEQEKRRNVAIALGMVVLITLLSIARELGWWGDRDCWLGGSYIPVTLGYKSNNKSQTQRCLCGSFDSQSRAFFSSRVSSFGFLLEEACFQLHAWFSLFYSNCTSK
uniref:Epidermal growth factor n=1 Tax=Hucho hucho TaxID=62062 RepID=A0A4W5JGK8_9TELE